MTKRHSFWTLKESSRRWTNDSRMTSLESNLSIWGFVPAAMFDALVEHKRWLECPLTTHHKMTYIKNALARILTLGDLNITAKRGIMSQLITISVCSASPADILVMARICRVQIVTRIERLKLRTKFHCVLWKRTTGTTIFSSLFNDSSTRRRQTPAKEFSWELKQDQNIQVLQHTAFEHSLNVHLAAIANVASGEWMGWSWTIQEKVIANWIEYSCHLKAQQTLATTPASV